MFPAFLARHCDAKRLEANEATLVAVDRAG
jgi:hypothetical protein